MAFQRRACLDHWNAKTQLLACRKQLDINGRPVWDSQVCIGIFAHDGIQLYCSLLLSLRDSVVGVRGSISCLFSEGTIRVGL